MFSVMWSEHCSYKSSKPLLRTLPTAGEGVVAGPGRERRRHLDRRRARGRVQDRVAQPPDARSSRTRAPRPASAASCATSSRWAPGRSRSSTRCASATRPTPRTRHLVDGVVRGVGGYGNCVGVPTVGGELVFDPSYEGNPLVNVMAIGLLEERRLTRAAAPGPGNLVVLFGSTTGRDGIGGASVLASATFADDDPSKRPSVQVGDPFAEKLLIEASPRAHRARPRRGPPGPRRRRDHLRDLGDRRPGRDRDRRRPRRDPAARARAGAVRGHDLRVAGADVRRRPAGALAEPSARSASAGACRSRSSGG